MADCLSAAVDLVMRTDGHQLGNHKMATIALQFVAHFGSLLLLLAPPSFPAPSVVF